MRLTIIRVIREHLRMPQTSAGLNPSWSEYNFDFTGATFGGGDLTYSRFNGTVSFARAVFSSGEVSFLEAVFSGGQVDLQRVLSWAKPPTFDPEVLENPPERLHLPFPTTSTPNRHL
ncbi:hypothetical protein SGFS_003160 [Streptomyces graminofaciens]|uniref:Uncharacterized protein n=1 Tax=Streptomyces graminofaciens TaxID=68212 RepID=A0ABN5V7X2_9ACTN|nr:pentapeptide repeat-containing protein [Streptomyces graminofaciens]BBC29025.1 hypothetical protein SGFS_003160 [Streptomyces graminofaciens]